jgi:peptidoglycan-associated lipoprotein
MDKMKSSIVVLAMALAFSAGCKKKDRTVPPPPPPVKDDRGVGVTSTTPPALETRATAPRIDSFAAEPARVERGQSITLRWATTGADTVTLDQGIGGVATTGTRQLFPTGTTTYVLIARNSLGSDTRTVTVEVSAAPISTQPQPGSNGNANGAGTVGTLIGQLQDIYFDYDMSEFRDDARRALNTDADLLKRIFAADARITFVIEGHADERGSAEYNLGLADRRAIVTRDALVQLGVPAARLRTVSFGEEAPVCRDETEACWQRNRRAHVSEVK